MHPPPFESLCMVAKGSRVHNVDGDLYIQLVYVSYLHRADVYFFMLVYLFRVQNIPLREGVKKIDFF